tara:strand:+ start:125 stop:355 length:231 start_codon:yes stop_codon:yes gene_type:complete
MINGKTFRHALDKFFRSPVCQDARVQIELPNGEFFDITGAKLLENKIIGIKEQETHRLVLTCAEPNIKMGKIVGKL